MQIVLLAIGSHGDVLPFLAIGAELRLRGYRVTLAALAPFQDLAVSAGLSFHPLGTEADFDSIARESALWHPRRGAALLLKFISSLTEETYTWLAAHCRAGDLIVAQPVCLGARLAQERLGLSLVTVHLAPFLIESRYAPPALPGLPLPAFLPSRLKHWIGRGADTYLIGPAVLPTLNTLRARLGLGPVRRLRYWWNSPDRLLLMFPPWYAPPQADWPLQAVQVGFGMADRLGDQQSLTPELEAFLQGGSPPLAFTYGSAMRLGSAFFEKAIALCRRMNRRGVLLAPQDGQVPADLPAEILHQPYAPFSLLLPRCAALIHHGGIGTVAQALAAGIPQLVVPVAFDHFDEGRHLQRLRVGAALSQQRFTPARAARVLQRLLNTPDVAQACSAAREHMRHADATVAACDEIEHMLAF
jgi:rhamnosyltransferase subunit B